MVLEDWAAALGLVLLNRSRENTLVRRTGQSVIDLTWANPTVAMVQQWEVAKDVDTSEWWSESPPEDAAIGGGTPDRDGP